MGIDDVLNQEVLILDFKRGQSKFKENARYTTVQFEMGGETHVLFTGSEVISDQLERYKSICRLSRPFGKSIGTTR